MAHSLEGRALYLQPAIVQAGLSLPQQQRIVFAASKIALRRIAGKWLPQWFAMNGSVEEFLESYKIDFLDMSETVKLIRDDVAKGVGNERFLFALVLLFEWYKSHRAFVAESYNI